MRSLLVFCLLSFVTPGLSLAQTAPELKVIKDIGYRPGDDLTAYEAERCKRDHFLHSYYYEIVSDHFNKII